MTLFLWGALAMACLVAGLCFLRFWRLSGDRLFVFFAAGFLIFGLNWTALAIAEPPSDTRHYFYVLRLVAFLVILAGILDKNRRRT